MRLQKTVRLFADRHLEKLGNVFETLYNDNLLTDCVLYCKDGSIKAHKVILAASSRYFRQVFIDHADDNAIFMYGISYTQLKNLIELIYRGTIDVPSDNFNDVYNLAEELNVSNIMVESSGDSKSNGIGRDTRYRGQKRVAVDFESKGNQQVSTPTSKNLSTADKQNNSECSPNKKETEKDQENSGLLVPKTEPNSTISNISDENKFVGHEILDEKEPVSVWAKKERKFKCEICPSSFKRASHLSRHQLVHTGERPYACDQCDKAFSRHDKLKHHIHKAHELGVLNEALGPDSLYTIDRVDILEPETVIASPPLSVPQSDQDTRLTLSSFDFTGQPVKKGRGRPRKYPLVEKPLFKRPRGRPRINPVAQPKRPRGRPRMTPIGSPFGQLHGSYQPYSNDFDNLSFLCKTEITGDPETSHDLNSQCGGENDVEFIGNQGFMEPLVEIKTEITEKSTLEGDGSSTNTSFFENIGLFENSAAIAKIGECTISVATNSNLNTPTSNT